MRVPVRYLRIFRFVFIGLLAWLSYQWLADFGLGVLVPIVAGVLALAWVAFRWRTARRRSASDAKSERWGQALLNPPLRPAALRELRAELATAEPGVGQAQSALVLAELLEADGDPKEALTVLTEVERGGLTSYLRTALDHGQAVAWLSMGEVDKAAEVLEDVDVDGDARMGAQLQLLIAYVELEQGRGERALTMSAEIRQEAGDDSDLKIEARVLKAAALDALGESAEAVLVMKSLGPEMLEVLSVLGLPRVKKIALSSHAEAEDESSSVAFGEQQEDPNPESLG